MARVVVVGLGPAGPDLLTDAARTAIARVPRRWVRTRRHPAVAAVPDADSFDQLYEQAGSFDEVYGAIAERLVAEATAHGEVLYAVPGSPAVAEESVARLRADGRVEVEVVPGLSFLDLAWARLGVDPVALGVRVVDGRRFAVEAAGERGPLLVAQCDSPLVLSDVKLAAGAVEGEGPVEVTVLQRLGLPDERVVTVAWDDLDRAVEPDHLTSLWIASWAPAVGGELARLGELVRTLRRECPWDREQTHQSLTRHLVEETYEVLEAIEALDRDEATAFTHLEEELGDLLLQVFLHATLAAEEGQFTLADVAGGLHAKLVHRHPHVFGDVEVSSAGEVMRNWEQLKQAEKGHTSVMGEVPGHLPALLYAHKVQRKAASVGFDWPAAGDVYPKVTEELEEVRADPTADEVGDLLFAVVNLARHLKIDPEAALRGATAKFRDRFMAVERLAEARDLDLPALDALWDEVKTTL